MKIKSFVFPSFEEWVKNSKEIKIKVGAYCCQIGIYSWISGTCKAAYKFAVSLANENPLNVYTDKLFCRTFKYEGDMEKLKEWYYNSINEFQIFWENYIKSTYIE